MKFDNTTNPELKSMSAFGVWISTMFTSGFYAFYWLWLQSRSEKTPLDLRIKRSANIAAIFIITYLISFFVTLIWSLNSRSDLGFDLPPVGPFLILGLLILLSLSTCVALLTQKLNTILPYKTNVALMVFLNFAWFLSIPALQKRINEVNTNQS